MTAHVHYDVEDITRRVHAEVERGCAKALETVADDEARQLVEAQRRIHLAAHIMTREMLALLNEGMDETVIMNAVCVVLSGHVMSLSQGFGPAFQETLARAMLKTATRTNAFDGQVTATPVKGGRA
ncbi:hypothetical protein [Stappia indica]|uniref:Uncharacterized protein n=1 Tax=Stappia indica TaxID=538381 RepID=A0A857C517_9HYPH|nr:hypothetical protein [Stappia indica]QGZ33945.1 hypothetical protein GH266_05115 [Stappia indica]